MVRSFLYVCECIYLCVCVFCFISILLNVLLFISEITRHPNVPGCAIPSLIFHYQCVCSVCVYDVGCFVDVLASRSGYCVKKLSVPMITIHFSSSVGMSIE